MDSLLEFLEGFLVDLGLVFAICIYMNHAYLLLSQEVLEEFLVSLSELQEVLLGHRHLVVPSSFVYSVLQLAHTRIQENYYIWLLNVSAQLMKAILVVSDVLLVEVSQGELGLGKHIIVFVDASVVQKNLALGAVLAFVFKSLIQKIQLKLQRVFIVFVRAVLTSQTLLVIFV